MLVLSAAISSAAWAQSTPREMRAATIKLTQWGYASGNIEGQKGYLRDLVMKLDQLGFNTLFVELQADGATGWQSGVQPSLICFTDKATGSMNYDPAQFVIDCCRDVNIDTYALVDPLHIGTPAVIEKYIDSKVGHAYYNKADMCTTGEGSEVVLNPGVDVTISYLSDLYGELSENYDFDGIIFDNVQYPLNGINDAETFQQNNPEFVTRDVWRRNNLTKLISALSGVIRSKAPYCRIAVTSEGTYQNRPGFYNPTAYGTYLQDAGAWMSRGYVDMVIPRMYHTEKEGFSRNLQFWIDSSAGRAVTVQLDTSTLTDYKGTTSSFLNEMIGKVRAVTGVYGISVSSTDFIDSYSSEPVAFKKALTDDIFNLPAHVGPLSFVTSARPGPPVNVLYDYDGFDYKLTWNYPHEVEAPIKYYSVYRLVNNELQPDNPLCNPVFKTSEMSAVISGLSDTDRFFVTAFDRNGKESQLVEATGVEAVKNDNEKFSMTFNGSHVSVESEIPVISFELYDSEGHLYINKDFAKMATDRFDFEAPRKKVLILRALTIDKRTITKKFIL